MVYGDKIGFPFRRDVHTFHPSLREVEISHHLLNIYIVA